MTDIPTIMHRTGVKLVAEINQVFEGHYAAGTIAIAGLLAVMTAESYDGHADRLDREIKEMADILNAGGIDPGDIKPPNLKISSFQPIHDRLSGQIVALQEEVERCDDDDAKALNARIWSYFAKGATERMPSPPDFSAERKTAKARLEGKA